MQSVPIDRFRQLEGGDILLIDSTHVLKTGSDVHYELFEILPALDAGVYVHFHDIHFPFEYPRSWIIDQRYSWNEIYALRAFLMYNRAFEVVFFTNMFGQLSSKVVAGTYPTMLKNIGGSIWLRKVFRA